MAVDPLLLKNMLFPLPCDKGGRGQLWNAPSSGLIKVVEQRERFQQRFVGFGGLELGGGEQFFGVLAQLGIATHQDFDGVDLSSRGKLFRFLYGAYKALAISRTDSIATYASCVASFS